MDKTVRQQLVEHLKRAENKRVVADVAKVDEATLSRIIKGERKISGDAVDRLAAYFKLELRPARPKQPRKGTKQ